MSNPLFPKKTRILPIFKYEFEHYYGELLSLQFFKILIAVICVSKTTVLQIFSEARTIAKTNKYSRLF